MVKESGPSIFFQSHLSIVPSGSEEEEPSNKILSVGNEINWSGPAAATGGLFPFIHPSQECSFLQEKIIPPVMISSMKIRCLMDYFYKVQQ